MWRTQLIAFILTVTTSVLASTYTDCANNGNLVNATVTPCTRTPCEIRSNQRTTLTIQFRADRLITGGQPSGTYWIWDWFPYRPSLVDHEMCSSTTPGCPFQMNGTIYTYQWVMNTGSIVASGSLNWELKDQTGETFVCVNVPLRSY